MTASARHTPFSGSWQFRYSLAMTFTLPRDRADVLRAYSFAPGL